jgi:hypothetical protein
LEQRWEVGDLAVAPHSSDGTFRKIFWNQKRPCFVDYCVVYLGCKGLSVQVTKEENAAKIKGSSGFFEYS